MDSLWLKQVQNLLQVLEEASKALTWLHEKQEAQAQLAKTDVPLLTAADIKKRQDTLQRVAEPIMSRPAPPPPVRPLSKLSNSNNALQALHFEIDLEKAVCGVS